MPSSKFFYKNFRDFLECILAIKCGNLSDLICETNTISLVNVPVRIKNLTEIVSFSIPPKPDIYKSLINIFERSLTETNIQEYFN